MADDNSGPDAGDRPSVTTAGFDAAGLEEATNQIGDRWSLRLIGTLLDGDGTFGELADQVDGIAPSILTARLRSLQRLGLLAAVPYARRPVRMRYSLTEPGRRLATSIASLAEWGARREGRGAGRIHGACGTAVESRPWCPTCDRIVDDDDATDDLIWC